MSKYVKYEDGVFYLTVGEIWRANPCPISHEEFQQLCDEVMELRDYTHERLVAPFVVVVKTSYDDYEPHGNQQTECYTEAFVVESRAMAAAAVAMIDSLASQHLQAAHMVDTTVPAWPPHLGSVHQRSAPLKLSDICCGMLATWLEHFSGYFKDRDATLAILHPRRLRYMKDCIFDDELCSELEELAKEKEANDDT